MTSLEAKTLIAGGAPTQSRIKAPLGPDAGQQQAWQREMERAQLANWLAARGISASAGANAAAESPQRDGPGRKAEDPVTRTAPGRLSHASLFGVQADAVPLPGDLVQQPLRQRAVQSSSAVNAERAFAPSHEPAAPERVDEANASSSPSMPSRATVSEAAAVRVHMERHAEGQVVWIAMRDGDTQARILSRLIADLRQDLAASGQKLHRVVCNGRLVWSDTASASHEAGADGWADPSTGDGLSHVSPPSIKES